MNHYTFTRNNRRYTRVSRAAALRAWMQGKEVDMIPCKLRAGAPWNPEAVFSDHEITPESFKRAENEAIFYNCNSETGRYLAFFVEG